MIMKAMILMIKIMKTITFKKTMKMLLKRIMKKN